MIHLWTINNLDDIELNIKDILKDKILSVIYRSDTSLGKNLVYEYFRYLDLITSSTGYCKKNGLNFKEAHDYCLRQTKLPKDYIFPKNNKDIIKYVEDNLEYDVIDSLIRTAIKGLRVSTKSIEAYIDFLNVMEAEEFKDKEGNPIDLSSIVTKMIGSISNIPKDIKKLQSLYDEQKSATQDVRGQVDYVSSMDADDDAEALGIIDDEE